MNWVGIFGKGVPGIEGLIEFLQAARENPDLQERADHFIAELSAVPAPENVATVVAAIASELPNIVKGHLDARHHPSDFSG